MKILGKILLLTLPLLIGGCYFRYAATSPALQNCQYAEGGGEVIEHLFVENYGWYLFGTIPLFCGDTDENNSFPLVFFEDQATREAITRRFNERVKELNAKAVGVSYVNANAVTFDVPGLNFPLVIPYIICTRDVQISGTLIKETK